VNTRIRITWFAASLLVVAALILSACGGPATTPAPTTAPTQPPPTEPPEPTATPEPTAVPLGEPLKIGVMSDLSGGLALFGNEMWEGLQLGFDVTVQLVYEPT